MLNYVVSHLIAFILSMIGSFFLNTYFTFNSKPTFLKFILFPLTNLANFTITTFSIVIFVDIFNFDPNISPLFASLIAIPITFLVTKKILAKKENP